MHPGIQRRAGRDGRNQAVTPVRMVHVLDELAVWTPVQVAGRV